jgi:hypothetical protein
MKTVLQDTLELRFGTGRGEDVHCAASCTYLALTCVKLQEKEKRISIRAAAAWSLCPGARSHHRYRGTETSLSWALSH